VKATTQPATPSLAGERRCHRLPRTSPGSQASPALGAGQNRGKDAITIYRAAAAAATTDDTDDNRCEDETDSEEAMSLNGDDSSSGGSGTGGCSMVPPPMPVVITAGASQTSHSVWHQKNNMAAYNNPAASLVPSCPCGCKVDDLTPTATSNSSSSASTTSSAQMYPESPASSPVKVRYPSTASDSNDAPLDMSKTSPVYGPSKPGMHSNNVTPPPTPPESEREKFRSLFMLVDAAVGQLEKEIAEKKEVTHQPTAAAATAQASCA
jgi:hypothetical protein